MDIKTEVLKILEAARAEIVQNMASEKITTTGKTADSLKVEERGSHLLLLQAEGNGAPIETVQYGREAGKVPYNFNSIIRQWIIDKGITTEAIPYVRQPSEKWQPKYTAEERGLMAAAGAIAHSIAKGGVKHPEGGTQRHREPNEKVYSEAIDKAIENITKSITDLVISEIRK